VYVFDGGVVSRRHDNEAVDDTRDAGDKTRP
jgi:hypothetical protein